MNINSLKLPEVTLKESFSIIVIQIEQSCFDGICTFLKTPNVCVTFRAIYKKFILEAVLLL